MFLAMTFEIPRTRKRLSVKKSHKNGKTYTVRYNMILKRTFDNRGASWVKMGTGARFSKVPKIFALIKPGRNLKSYDYRAVLFT